MRPDAKFHGSFHDQSRKKVINGPRPSPLMISKDSHLIGKPSGSVSDIKPQKKQHHQQQQQQRQPIIIYTHSPKIIHTKPQDFMALVQRLTGKSSSSKEEAAISTQIHEASENYGSSSLSDGSNNSSSTSMQMQMQRKKSGGSDVDHETSSALRRESSGCIKVEGVHQLSPFGGMSMMGLADIPLFTPNSSDFIFCSSRPPAVVFKDSDSPFGILGSLISPSGLEFIKELPEY